MRRRLFAIAPGREPFRAASSVFLRRAGAFALAAGVPALILLAAHSTAPASLSAVPEPAVRWNPRSYACLRASGPICVDGRMTEGDWSAAPWTEAFVDIEGGSMPAPPHLTRVKMLWDDEFFYVAARMEEPDLWATLTERDAVIYHDNDFEVFVDPDGDTHEYYELEINALGTEWDLMLLRPYRDGGPAVDAWDIQGLETAVFVDGTLNDPADTDASWSVEIAMPWSVLDDCAHRPSPPGDGDRWRINFSRVQWRLEVEDGAYVKSVDPVTGDALPESNWVWSPQGLIAMHYPEMWGFVEFSEAEVGAVATEAGAAPGVSALSNGERAVWALRRVYYRERNLYAQEGRFTADPDELGLDLRPRDGYDWPPSVVVTPFGFEAWLATDDGDTLTIDERGRVVRQPVQ